MGPGVTSPKRRCSGCKPVTLEASRPCVSSRAPSGPGALGVDEELAVDGVGDPPLQAGFSFKSHTPTEMGRHFVGQPAGTLDATGGPSASMEILHQAHRGRRIDR